MDRIRRIRIKNVRAIEDVDLELSWPITVLIGDNGAGKSTIIECLELLRQAAELSFFQRLYTVHRGMPGLLRKGATSLELGVVIEDDGGALPRLEYSFELASQGAGAVVLSELLLVDSVDVPGQRLVALKRSTAEGQILEQQRDKLVTVPIAAVVSERLVIGNIGRLPQSHPLERLLAVLRGIETHLGFDTLASWAARAVQRVEPIRGATTHFPAERLSLLGANLANAWSELRNREASHWEHTMALVRLGLGDRVDSVVVTPDHGGGSVYLGLRFTDLSEVVPASNLSDGQLAWLAFIAMARLKSNRSLLAIDEPELHLHPSLLGRVMALLCELDGQTPVLLSTHADRVLELLDDPASAVRVCSLEGSRATVSRLDGEELPKWLESFGDLGQLRASGYLTRLLVPSMPIAPVTDGDDVP